MSWRVCHFCLHISVCGVWEPREYPISALGLGDRRLLLDWLGLRRLSRHIMEGHRHTHTEHHMRGVYSSK